VMIDLGEAEIFEGQVTQAVNGAVRRELALAHFLEKLADGFGVQSSKQISILRNFRFRRAWIAP